jgi:hypothetical protein
LGRTSDSTVFAGDSGWGIEGCSCKMGGRPEWGETLTVRGGGCQEKTARFRTLRTIIVRYRRSSMMYRSCTDREVLLSAPISRTPPAPRACRPSSARNRSPALCTSSVAKPIRRANFSNSTTLSDEKRRPCSNRGDRMGTLASTAAGRAASSRRQGTA